MESLSAARSLVPTLRQHRDQTESERQLPAPVVEALIESKLCRLAHPTDLEGGPWEPEQALAALATVAGAEASAAWIVWNNWLPALFGRSLVDDARAEILGDRRQLLAISTRPTGKLVADGDDYRLSGRWALVSGCVHADRIGFMAPVERDGEIEEHAPGAPHLRVAFLPRGSYQIVDTWHVGGLRGTGSHDVVVGDIEVAAKHTVGIGEPSRLDEPIGRIPIISTMGLGHAALTLGIASAALGAVTELGRTKISADPSPDLRDRARSQHTIATGAAEIDAHRRQIHAIAGDLWRHARAAEPTSHDDLAAAWGAISAAQNTSLRVVRDLYGLAGTTALYVDSPLERAHRDLHAASQHVVAQPFWAEDAGRVRFGLEPQSPLFAL